MSSLDSGGGAAELNGSIPWGNREGQGPSAPWNFGTSSAFGLNDSAVERVVVFSPVVVASPHVPIIQQVHN